MIEWLKLVPYAGGILIFILIAEFLHKKKLASISFTRKFVHLGVGVVTFYTPFMFEDVQPLIFIAASFVLVNALTLYFKTFKGMDAQRKTYGTIMFPVSFLILLLFAWEENRFLIAYGIALMTFADGMASIVGEQVKKPQIYFPVKDKKSVQGSVALFLSSVIITFLFIQFKLMDIPVENIANAGDLILIIILMGIIATLLENISVYGSDNITLPLLGSFFLLHFLEMDFDLLLKILGIFIILLLVAMISFYKKWLTTGGGMTMILIGLLVSVFRSWKLLIPLFLFFVLSSLLSKIRDKRDHKKHSVEEKGSIRDATQVLANGILPAIVITFSFVIPESIILLAFGAAIAAVNADTWSTEIGFFSKKNPVSIRDFKTVSKGSSGGITLLGTFGGFMGALVISVTMFLIFPDKISFMQFLIMIFAGFAGSIFDSILGATIQVKYQCTECGKITEKKKHCNLESAYANGIKFISNDVVNVFCAISSVLMTFILSFLFYF